MLFTNALKEENGILEAKYRHQTMRKLQLTKAEKGSLKLKEIHTFKGENYTESSMKSTHRSVDVAECLLNYLGAQKYGTGNA
ncbi:MAG: hypothetical protein R2799_05790 [Crocinitomicaceae bacterium]